MTGQLHTNQIVPWPGLKRKEKEKTTQAVKISPHIN
jgi:hypothetical protein